MKIAFFDTHRFERPIFERENATLKSPHELSFLDARVTPQTAIIAKGYPAICVFVNDAVTADVVSELADAGLKLIALRSAGFNHVDLAACQKHGVTVMRVPAYSPHAIAEHAVGLILVLNRKIHRAYQRVRELNFSLEGLVGFDLQGKTVGVIGTGKIGAAFAQIMRGFGCKVLAYDPFPDNTLITNGVVTYVPLNQLYGESNIISLHVPLKPETRHLIGADAIAQMKRGVVIINTGRGALIDTKALIEALKTGQIGAAGLDVYEEEEGIFFFDLSGGVLRDDVLARLLTFPNVIITAHQAFLTEEALGEIARTTLCNITDFEQGRTLKNQVRS